MPTTGGEPADAYVVVTANADRLPATALLGQPTIVCDGDGLAIEAQAADHGVVHARPYLLAMYGVLLLLCALYPTIVVGSLTRVWGVDYTLDWRHYVTAITRGNEAFLDTAFPEAVATPIASDL